MDILLIVLAVFGLSFFIAYVYTAKQLRVTTQQLAESVLLYLATVDQSNQTQTASVDNEKSHNESFIKFLSDSRDWAFGYIEEVQNSLKSFINEVEPQIEHYNKYGIVIEGMAPPHDFALKKISKELDNLKKLLPEDIDDRR